MDLINYQVIFNKQYYRPLEVDIDHFKDLYYILINNKQKHYLQYVLVLYFFRER